ncbi:MAG: C13 family peptidase, partial [Caulobacterales bacterium]
DTAIITAASADRSSFGCQPERDWTYFGDALFANALSNGATLLDGFEQAKVLIQQWESEQGMTPSEPSQAIGPKAAIFLADLEKRRPKTAH